MSNISQYREIFNKRKNAFFSLNFSVFCSDRMSTISRLQLRRSVQKVGNRFCDFSTGRRMQRGLHFLLRDSYRMA